MEQETVRGEPSESSATVYPSGSFRLGELVSSSPRMQALLALARRVVDCDTSLLIQGETGAGKEWVARAIQRAGPRRDGPFVAVNCGGVPESLLESELFGHEKGAFTGAVRARRGFFELADKGVIFLDEIGDMPLHLQVRLLRVLQERRVQRLGGEAQLELDVRIMAATNRDLLAEVEGGRFRADLYYRLSVVTMTIPALRERREDIPALAEWYLAHFRSRLKRPVVRVDADAMAALVEYEWPGNLRELANVLERAVLLCSGAELGLGELPESLARQGGVHRAGMHRDAGDHVSGTSYDAVTAAGALAGMPIDFPQTLLDKPFRRARQDVLGAFERWYLSHWLRATGGRIDRTARHAGVDARSIFEKMRRCALTKESFRPADLLAELHSPPAGDGVARERPGGPAGRAPPQTSGQNLGTSSRQTTPTIPVRTPPTRTKSSMR